MQDMKPLCAGCCGCGACGRCCTGCCAGGPELSEIEAALLRHLAQLAFLPLAFTAAEQPVYRDKSLAPPQELSAAVASLLRKGLITADPLPLLNHSYDEYEDFPHLGSMALTAAGQDAAELLDINGKLC